MSTIADPRAASGDTPAAMIDIPRFHADWCPGCLDASDRTELLRLVGLGVLKIVRRPGESPVFLPGENAAEQCLAVCAEAATSA